jgi:hypothetical protein
VGGSFKIWGIDGWGIRGWNGIMEKDQAGNAELMGEVKNMALCAPENVDLICQNWVSNT